MAWYRSDITVPPDHADGFASRDGLPEHNGTPHEYLIPPNIVRELVNMPGDGGTYDDWSGVEASFDKAYDDRRDRTLITDGRVVTTWGQGGKRFADAVAQSVNDTQPMTLACHKDGVKGDYDFTVPLPWHATYRETFALARQAADITGYPSTIVDSDGEEEFTVYPDACATIPAPDCGDLYEQIINA
jgi:hypothetical protein